MSRFLLRLLAFLLLCLPVYGGLVVLTEQYGPNFMQDNLPFPERGSGMLYTRLGEVQRADTVDVLVLGSSHAYRGYDPRVFAEAGWQMFNLGSSNQTPLQTEVLLRRYLDRLSPRLVVFDVYPWAFSADGVEATLDLLANDRRLSGMLPLLWRQGNVKTVNAYALALHRRWGGGFDRLTADTARRNDTYVPGGFVERELAYYDGSRSGLDRRLTWHEGQFAAFDRCLALLRERGIPVVLVQSPVTSVQRAAYENLADFNRRMAATGLPYLDWTALPGLEDRRHFFDSHHLNQEGVARFNRALLEQLAAYSGSN